MRRMLNVENKTQETITISTFDSPMYFHYCLLEFQESNIRKQGRVLDQYFIDGNFLLIPRSEFEEGADENSCQTKYVSLLLFWTKDPQDCQEIEKNFSALLRRESEVKVYARIVLNNGENRASLFTSESDADGCYASYVISHRYKDGKYIYKLTSSMSFAKAIGTLLAGQNLNPGVVLDMVFTGRVTNQFNNTYSFNKYKIKDYYIKDGEVFLSNVAGVINLRQLKGTGNSKTVHFFNFLVGNRGIDDKLSIGSYSGMSLSTYTFIPEKLIEVKQGVPRTLGKLKPFEAIKNAVILPENEEDKQQIVDLFFTVSIASINSNWLKKQTKVSDVLRNFYEGRISEEKRELQRRKEDILSRIAYLARDKKSLEEQILLSEHRIKEFIPMPFIKIPEENKIENGGEVRIPDLTSMIRHEDGKYFLEEKGEI